MSYQPKPGEKVTSPLLVGEWEYSHKYDSDTSIVRLGKFVAQVDTGGLTPVAPPIPAEPPVGSVVWAEGHYWIRDNEGVWCKYAADLLVCDSWESIGPDASPVVAVSQVADWLRDYDADVKACLFVERFGWPDE